MDTANDPAHCGGCGMACESGPNAASLCQAGTCAISCDEGFADCDGDPASGCEVDTTSDASHCGGCGMACGPGLHCVSAQCKRLPFGDGRDGELSLEGGAAPFVLPTVVSPVEAAAEEIWVRPESTEGFAVGQLVMLHQSRGGGETPTGTWRLRVVQEVADDGRLFLDESLDVTFRTSGDGAHAAQILVVPQHTRVLIPMNARLRARRWDGSTGGILALVASEEIVVQGGRIDADGAGYRGGPGARWQGEGQTGGPSEDFGGTGHVGGGTAARMFWGTGYYGGGGGHAEAGEDFVFDGNGVRTVAPGGQAYEPAEGVLRFGGGGGGWGWLIGTNLTTLAGGGGGGAIFLGAPRFTLEGRILARGGNPMLPPMGTARNGGSGAGGTIWIRTEEALQLGTQQVDARGGTTGAIGAPGRVVVEGATSVSGTSQPPFERLGGGA